MPVDLQRTAVEPPETQGVSSARLKFADLAAQRLIAAGEVPGISLAVMRHGHLIHEAYFGLAHPASGQAISEQTIFAVASITKLVAATAMLLLVERGQVGLRTPIAVILPEFGQNGKGAVHLQHLLTHTSGIDETFIGRGALTSLEAYLERIYQAPLLWTPGTRVAYCNAGYDLLIRIIEKLTGMPHPRFVSAELLEPLGMRDSYLCPPEQVQGRIADCRTSEGDDPLPLLVSSGALSGALFSTARDIGSFGQLFLDQGRGVGGQVLSPRSVAAMLLDRTDGLQDTGSALVHRGLGWLVARPFLGACDLAAPGSFGHSGASGSFLCVDPVADMVIAFMANRWDWKQQGRAEVLNACLGAVVEG